MSGVGRRPADFFARYGGEEFVLLLPETDTANAVLAAERIQEQIKYHNIPHAFSKAADHVTVSIGISTITPTDKFTPFDLIDQADKHLYEAKNSGRNRYISEMDLQRPVSR
jgi:diguanylate cyclase (GGDEF)-like protein